jgi:hypothetical protein
MWKSKRHQEGILNPKHYYYNNGRHKIPCRKLFRKSNSLPLGSEFLLSVLKFDMDNMEKCKTNSDKHDKMHRYDLCVPSTKFSIKYQFMMQK